MLGVEGKELLAVMLPTMVLVSENEIKTHKEAEVRELTVITVVLEVLLHSLFFWLLYKTSISFQ